MPSAGACVVGWSVGISVLVTAIVLIAVSFGAVEPTEYGLLIYGTSQTIDPNVYTAGRHYIGLGSYFIKYPATVISDRFAASEGTESIVARSSDGLSIIMDCSFDYRVIQNELKSLYLKFPSAGISDELWHVPITKTAKDIIRQSASKFPAFSFFGNRNNVSATIFQDLAAQLPLLHISVSSFQLLDISLPAAFSSAIQQTQVVSQNIQTSLFAQQQAQITTTTQIEAASRQAAIIRAKAAADGANAITQAQAQAATIIQRVDNLADAYALLKTNYSMTESELLSYIWLQSISETAATVVYAAAKPTDISF